MRRERVCVSVPTSALCSAQETSAINGMIASGGELQPRRARRELISEQSPGVAHVVPQVTRLAIRDAVTVGGNVGKHPLPALRADLARAAGEVDVKLGPEMPAASSVWADG
jgi:xanthine dehydrogenase iron-sulfur cluster and FAD-binding subunit A